MSSTLVMFDFNHHTTPYQLPYLSTTTSTSTINSTTTTRAGAGRWASGKDSQDSQDSQDSRLPATIGCAAVSKHEHKYQHKAQAQARPS